MKRLLFTLAISSLSIFNLSCDAESLKVIIDEAKAALGTPGCMQQGNASFDNLATVHVDSLCADLNYGCIDSMAVNYDATATDMCQSIAAELCCTSVTSGCLDLAATNYNSLANTHDATACTYNTSGSGCLVTTACNYYKQLDTLRTVMV